ncbi:MAG TPA: FMN-binding negative transcriptional regulator [Edaphobacter sp.]|jgi:transcriptional regulator|nr:FMN-binding negative transcriptional regulator [Edaphobacter sp.]
MYIPRHHEETRIDVLDRLMCSQPLASLVTMGSSGLFASHLPMLLHRESDDHAVLRAHLSRANRQWRDLSPDVQALAIFSGPQHYITPGWYPEKAETGKVVPTWNYAVVHAYGPLRLIEDPEWLLAHLNTLVDTHEASQPAPWSVSDAPEEFISSLLKGIVGLEMKIERLEGKWKVSQNQTERTRASVMQGLASLGTEPAVAMRDLVDGKRP